MRPFLTEEIVLANYEDDRNLHNEDELRDLLAEKVDEMLSSMHEENQTTPMTADAESRLRYPIVRLKVDYTGYSTINMQRFGQRFVDKVANPTSLLHFHRKAKRKARVGTVRMGMAGTRSRAIGIVSTREVRMERTARRRRYR